MLKHIVQFEEDDPPRTRTWNLRLRRPTPYPLGQRAAGDHHHNQVHRFSADPVIVLPVDSIPAARTSADRANVIATSVAIGAAVSQQSTIKSGKVEHWALAPQGVEKQAAEDRMQNDVGARGTAKSET